MSDIALEIGKESGGWYKSAQEAVVVNGKWKAIPFGNIGQLMNWRTDWFKEAGYDKFPDTWDELLEAGIKLKKAGHPFGFELGHGFGDNHGWLYPLLWSYGGREVEADGKTIVINSDETARAIDFCRKFFKATMSRTAWAGPTSATTRRSCRSRSPHQQRRNSILVGQKDFPEIAKVTPSENPKGSKGRFHMPNCSPIRSRRSAPRPTRTSCAGPRPAAQAGARFDIAVTDYEPFRTRTMMRRCWKVEAANLLVAIRRRPHLPGLPGAAQRAQLETIGSFVVIEMPAKACAAPRKRRRRRGAGLGAPTKRRRRMDGLPVPRDGGDRFRLDAGWNPRGRVRRADGLAGRLRWRCTAILFLRHLDQLEDG